MIEKPFERIAGGEIVDEVLGTLVPANTGVPPSTSGSHRTTDSKVGMGMMNLPYHANSDSASSLGIARNAVRCLEVGERDNRHVLQARVAGLVTEGMAAYGAGLLTVRRSRSAATCSAT